LCRTAVHGTKKQMLSCMAETAFWGGVNFVVIRWPTKKRAGIYEYDGSSYEEGDPQSVRTWDVPPYTERLERRS